MNKIDTPMKFNMGPENKSLEKEIPNLESIIIRLHVGGVYSNICVRKTYSVHQQKHTHNKPLVFPSDCRSPFCS